jgi:alpha-L-fucosidase 2
MRRVAIAVLLVVWAVRSGGAEDVKTVRALDDCNVVWDSPSGDSFGSMPLGNGDVGANVWVEKNGDVVFYVSKVDAFDSGHLLPKLGRVRLQFQPALDVDKFLQALVLKEGAIEIQGGDVTLRVWVDANAPVIRVTGKSRTPVQAVASFETLRGCDEMDDQSDRLAWAYRNSSSAWIERVRSQNSAELAARVSDPILNRTSGCRMSGMGFTRDGKRSLRMKASGTIDLTVRVCSSHAGSLADWFAEIEKPVSSDWDAHRACWASFWNRSYIFVAGCGEGSVSLDQCRYTQFAQGSKAYEGHKEIPGAVNAFQLSQRYALERFCEAAASRGAVPPPYNGSIFTMDMPAGVMGFNAPKGGPVSPDGRDWAVLSFMWQNTRHPYWSMPVRGDYDTIVPGMRFVRGGLEVGYDRCRKLLGLDGAFIMEASWWHNVGVFNWDGMPGHLRYHQLATIELPAIMAETYEHTRDRKFLDEVLLPCADAGLAYYASRFTKRDAAGRMMMEGVGCAETFQGVLNPCTEIGCLKYLLTKLLSFDIDDARRQRWTKLLAEMPGVPTRRIRGMNLLAVGDVYDSGREICESPELYSVYPFRQAWLGTPELLACARQSFHVRNISLDGTDDKQAVETGGWQSAPVQAAYLGLAREAARLVSINFNDQFVHWTDNVDPGAPFPKRPRARFPAFWECKMDGTPDNDHGANSANALQSMLLQCDGRKILLLPAWPENWDVSFKLCAAGNTTVECEYRAGRVQTLRVTPESRRVDIVDFSTPEARVRTLTDVACADRNYLFGLPPMLDGLPKPGPATSAWLAKYGESVTDVKGAPWPHWVFRDNILYAHDGAAAPAIPAKVVSSKRLSDSILKVEYDQKLEPLALSWPSDGSLTGGGNKTTVDLGSPRSFDRLEFTIDNPSHRRGEHKSFELQVGQPDGSWRTVHRGNVFGTIYGKRFAPVTAQQVRLVIDAPVRQFDLFPPGV